MTLGAQLAAISQTKKCQQEQAARNRSEQAKAKADAELLAVTSFFAQVQQDVTTAISRGAMPKPAKLGFGGYTAANVPLRLWSWFNPAAWIDKPAHPYFSVWVEFAAWAAENELRPVWRYDTDGVGIEAWMTLSVVPAGA